MISLVMQKECMNDRGCRPKESQEEASYGDGPLHPSCLFYQKPCENLEAD